MIFVEKKLLQEMRDEEPLSWMGIMWNSVKKQFSEPKNSTSTRKSWVSPQTSVTCNIKPHKNDEMKNNFVEKSQSWNDECYIDISQTIRWIKLRVQMTFASVVTITKQRSEIFNSWLLTNEFWPTVSILNILSVRTCRSQIYNNHLGTKCSWCFIIQLNERLLWKHNTFDWKSFCLLKK